MFTVPPTIKPYNGKFRDIFMLFMFIFSLVSIVVMGVATYGTVALSDLKHFYGIGIGISLLAAIIFIVSSLGCCAAFYRSADLMKFVSGIVFFLFLGQIAFGVLLYMRRDNIDELTIRVWNSNATGRKAIEDAFDCKDWINTGSNTVTNTITNTVLNTSINNNDHSRSNTSTNTGANNNDHSRSNTSDNTGFNTSTNTIANTSSNTSTNNNDHSRSNTSDHIGSNTSTNTSANTGSNTSTNISANSNDHSRSNTSANTGSNISANNNDHSRSNTSVNIGSNTSTNISANNNHSRSNTSANSGSSTSTNTSTNTGSNTSANSGSNSGSGSGGSPRCCRDAIAERVESFKNVLLGAASALGLFELMGSFGGCFLAIKLSRGDSPGTYMVGY